MMSDQLASNCGCALKFTHDLLCACQLHGLLATCSRVPINVLDEFWRKLEYDGFEAMPVCDEDRLKELFAEIRDADPSLRSNIYDALYSQFHLDEEDVEKPAMNEHPRGRPKGKKATTQCLPN
ncbi:hypothetical protein KSS87_003500 [Heliosperma pusillum]|nr:hypothetical protein KSS87_003500 [Heliosperma pusillum]